MAKRHTMRPGDWESIFGRLEELVLANSGEDDFQEIFKLLVAKLFAEIHPGRQSAFRLHAAPARTAQAVNRLLLRASRKWSGVLPEPPLSRLTDEHLAVCVEALQDQPLLDAGLEALDGVFEHLVNREAKGAKGQFFTPRHVIDACVRIIDPKPDETVLDPACGSGGFLVHVLNHVRAGQPRLDTRHYCRDHLWGCDFDGRAVQVARALLQIAGGPANVFQLNSLLTAASGDGVPQLTIEDTVRKRLRPFHGFDIVLTNPPFAGEVREPQLRQSYQLAREGRRVERDVLFLERCVGLLRPGGRLGIVLPHSKLGGAGWSGLREWLLHRVRVVAVLGLGRNTFLPHTHQKAAVLFGVKRERPVRTPTSEKILFLISEKDGKDSRGQIISRPGSRPDDPAWTRADHDLGELVERFGAFRDSAGIEWGR